MKAWLPQRYHEDQKTSVQDLQEWYERTRNAVAHEVFTKFPHVASAYFKKLCEWVNEQEETRLKELITRAILSGTNGWKDDFPPPKIFIKFPEPPKLQLTVSGELTPPLTPLQSSTISNDTGSETNLSSLYSQPSPTPEDVPLYLDFLPFVPPVTCVPRPPPADMTPEAKLRCLARWTSFDRETGTPSLTTVAQETNTETTWTEAVYYGATDDTLVSWAKDMWWPVWVRQSHVNYVGMWKRRAEKEDKKRRKIEEGKENRQLPSPGLGGIRDGCEG